MGSIETRPTTANAETIDNLFIGMPFVDIALQNSDGSFGNWRNLGIVETAAIAKEIELASLKSAQSGTDVLVRELVRSFEARLNVGVFDFAKENFWLFMAADDSTVADLTASPTVIVDESQTLNTAGATSWTDLNNVPTAWTSLDPGTETAEAVGTGDGTLGQVSGEYSLDYKVAAVSDVTSVTVAGVAYTPVAVGAATSGDEVEVVVGTGADSGDLRFSTASSYADVTGAIVATYTPTHTFTENTNYVVDYEAGRIRPINISEATTLMKPGQTVLADYTHQQASGSTLVPFTKFVFTAKCRVRQLTDVGINFTWEIPLVNVRLTDDDFEFSRDEFGVGNVSVTMVDDGSATPFGTIYLYDETAA